MDFTLNLLIDTEDLRTIRDAGENVLIAKPVNGSEPNVVWLDFDPFEANEVQWSEEYGIYVSNAQVQQGANISKLSETGVGLSAETFYALESDATFHGPTGDSAPAGSFGADNQMPSSSYRALTFGLTQSAIVQGNQINLKPINAQSVPAMQQATFTPLTTIFVWLDALVVSETVITNVSSPMTRVTFGGQVTEQTLRYDAAVGKFVVQT
jgi:hypothetical protein